MVNLSGLINCNYTILNDTKSVTLSLLCVALGVIYFVNSYIYGIVLTVSVLFMLYLSASPIKIVSKLVNASVCVSVCVSTGFRASGHLGTLSATIRKNVEVLFMTVSDCS